MLPNLLRSLIREAVASAKPQQVDPNMWKAVTQMRFDRDKLLSLMARYLKSYGYNDGELSRSTFDKIQDAIRKDPYLKRVDVDAELCNDFMTALRNKELFGRTKDPVFIQKVFSAFHSSTLMVRDLELILRMMYAFFESRDKEKGGKVDSGEFISFQNIWLKKALPGKYVFKDDDGNYYHKLGNPPAIILRKRINTSNLLTKVPYEMYYNDVYSLKAKVVRSRPNVDGHIINMIHHVSPI